MTRHSDGSKTCVLQPSLLRSSWCTYSHVVSRIDRQSDGGRRFRVGSVHCVQLGLASSQSSVGCCSKPNNPNPCRWQSGRGCRDCKCSRRTRRDSRDRQRLSTCRNCCDTRAGSRDHGSSKVSQPPDIPFWGCDSQTACVRFDHQIAYLHGVICLFNDELGQLSPVHTHRLYRTGPKCNWYHGPLQRQSCCVIQQNIKTRPDRRH
mmetsp:Transcript_89190/g.238935  ORF Transcript_89190/g.238935 Transcript_89190/m.238935 type:complete len:205 (-) Transcript_89190:838-1452(-)